MEFAAGVGAVPDGDLVRLAEIRAALEDGLRSSPETRARGAPPSARRGGGRGGDLYVALPVLARTRRALFPAPRAGRARGDDRAADPVTVNCDFCAKQYSVTVEDMQGVFELIAKAKDDPLSAASAGPRNLHHARRVALTFLVALAMSSARQASFAAGPYDPDVYALDPRRSDVPRGLWAHRAPHRGAAEGMRPYMVTRYDWGPPTASASCSTTRPTSPTGRHVPNKLITPSPLDPSESGLVTTGHHRAAQMRTSSISTGLRAALVGALRLRQVHRDELAPAWATEGLAVYERRSRAGPGADDRATSR